MSITRTKRLPPGVKVMWWGLQRLDGTVCGWEAALKSVQAKGVLTQDQAGSLAGRTPRIG